MIKLSVTCQTLKACCVDALVSDSLNAIEFQFEFSCEWDGMTKTAQFTQQDTRTKQFSTYNVLLGADNTAMLPNEITDGVVLCSVFGVEGVERLTTNALAFPVVKSGFVADGETPIPPTPDLYQQLIAEVQAFHEDAAAPASASTLGRVKVGSGLAVTSDGTLSTKAHTHAQSEITGLPDALGNRSRAVNLLDNSYFLEPVNQRGASSYTGAVYGIDRWAGGTSVTIVKPVALAGVSIQHTGTTSVARISQALPPQTIQRLLGATVTLAICLDDGTIYASSGALSAYGIGVNFTGGRFELYSPAQMVIHARITNNVPGSTLNVRWVAMYEGEYTASNLPAYMPKGYLAELLECQRYYRRVRSGMLGFITKATGYFSVHTDIPMRITPTVVVEDYGSIRAGGANITPTAITATSAAYNSVSINATYAEQTLQNHVGVLTSTLALSADL